MADYNPTSCRTPTAPVLVRTLDQARDIIVSFSHGRLAPSSISNESARLILIAYREGAKLVDLVPIYLSARRDATNRSSG